MGRDDLTAHGFRATFRTWASEQTNFPTDVIEAALAHTQGKLHEAYQRGDLLDKRRRLMAAWADFCGNVPGVVVTMRSATA
jgi:integrase